MSPKRDWNDEQPVFLIPRIPGTGLLAGVGLSLVALMVVSALMRSQTESDDAPPPSQVAAPVAEGALTLHLSGPDEQIDLALQALDPDPLGAQMWRLTSPGAAFLLLREPDGLWLHDLTAADVEEVERILAQAGANLEIELSGPDPSSSMKGSPDGNAR
ncbi:MAG: hypothetical protein EA397_05175 [Deltaproteobacteria bacterium]|nr:MAG: hypothetical protein EA397_05175 [Deltaproteobacteria bacterium]